MDRNLWSEQGKRTVRDKSGRKVKRGGALHPVFFHGASRNRHKVIIRFTISSLFATGEFSARRFTEREIAAIGI